MFKVQLEIRCPQCSIKGKIEIDDTAVKDASKGLIAINITPGMICEHQFVAYLDKNLKVRDALIADFHIEIISEIQKEAERKLSIDLIDMDLIRLNLTPQILAYVLSYVFHKKKIVLIFEESHLFNHFQNFFKYITKDSFTIDITLLPLKEYMARKPEFLDYIILGRNEILRDEERIINTKKLKIEKGMVDTFFKERDLKVSIIILKNEIQKVYNLSKTLGEIIKENKEFGVINLKEARSRLERIYNTKLSQSHLEFILKITKSYFDVSLQV
ncbi:MAG: hypothetical protein ACTSR8_00550 [Promethearchaeota archaeon]